MNTNRILTIALIVALVAVPIGAADDVYPIDADHGLASDQSIAKFESTGVASANLTELDMTITVSDDDEDVDLEGFRMDSNRRYLRLQYREDIPRTVRIYIPSEYFKPRVKQELEAIDADVSADLEPTEDREYTAVTVRFDGPTDVVFPINRVSGYTFWTRGKLGDLVSNATGFELPSITASTQWSYLPDTAFSSNTTYRLENDRENLTLQYDTDKESHSAAWIPVPECEDIQDQDVCYVERDGETTIYSTADDPPPVRYKLEKDTISSVRSWTEDLKQIPKRARNLLDGIFGGL